MLSETEFELGDTRLDARARLILNQLKANPKSSFPAVFSRYADLEGFYRFVNNDRINFEDILAPFIQQTYEHLLESGQEALVLHDTTQVCPKTTGRSIQEFRAISTKNNHGFLTHLSLAVSGDGSRKILGPLDAYLWTRGKKKVPKVCRKEDNENHRWANQILRVEERMHKRGNVIHVADREADAYEGFCKIIDGGARFVIRMTWDRAVHSMQGNRLFECFEDAKPLATREVVLSERKPHHYEKTNQIHPPRNSRIAHLEIAAKRVIIKRSRRRAEYPPAITMNIVRVYEPNPPKGQKPVQWYLITTEPISTKEQVEKVVDIYKTRWVIEEYFKALKTGCSLEDRYLESAQAWYKTLALFIPVACTIYNLKTLSGGNEVFSSTQWEILQHIARSNTRECNNLEDAKREVAQLGGHIKWAGPPGWITLSRGYFKLLELEAGWNLSRSAICDQR